MLGGPEWSQAGREAVKRLSQEEQVALLALDGDDQRIVGRLVTDAVRQASDDYASLVDVCRRLEQAGWAVFLDHQLPEGLWAEFSAALATVRNRGC